MFSFGVFVEMRDRVLGYLQSLVPQWPPYIVKDFLYKGFKSNPNKAEVWLQNFAKHNGYSDPQEIQWQQQNLQITLDAFDDNTKEMLKQRMGGEQSQPVQPQVQPQIPLRQQQVNRMKNLQGNLTNPDQWQQQASQNMAGTIGGGAVKDAKRHATQQQLLQAGPSQEPIIVVATPNGYRLEEGWHRTIQSLKKWPEGYQQPAWVMQANRSYDANDAWA